jgi:hypothetical protein
VLIALKLLSSEASANVDDRTCGPLAAARSRELAIIEGLRSGVRTLARELGQDLAELLRASVGLLT